MSRTESQCAVGHCIHVRPQQPGTAWGSPEGYQASLAGIVHIAPGGTLFWPAAGGGAFRTYTGMFPNNRCRVPVYNKSLEMGSIPPLWRKSTPGGRIWQATVRGTVRRYVEGGLRPCYFAKDGSSHTCTGAPEPIFWLEVSPRGRVRARSPWTLVGHLHLTHLH